MHEWIFFFNIFLFVLLSEMLNGQIKGILKKKKKKKKQKHLSEIICIFHICLLKYSLSQYHSSLLQWQLQKTKKKPLSYSLTPTKCLGQHYAINNSLLNKRFFIPRSNQHDQSKK